MIVLQSADAGPVITLDEMTADDAATLGHAFAGIEPWVRYPFSPEALSGYLSTIEPGAPRYALRVDGTLAGAVGTREVWLRGPYLQFLGILPSHQRHGLGRLTLAWFEGVARARDNRNLWVAASDFNQDALRFYEHHGFHRVALFDDLAGDGITEILLRKRLCDKK